jgi:hypothetical protein
VLLPFPPMRGMNLNRLLTFGPNPSAQNAPTWKYERMRLAPVDHRELKVPIERSSGNRLPIHWGSK